MLPPAGWTYSFTGRTGWTVVARGALNGDTKHSEVDGQIVGGLGWGWTGPWGFRSLPLGLIFRLGLWHLEHHVDPKSAEKQK